ncbi:MAG: hypothetical protein P8X90_31005 [Desulfobacterales bacterium]
MVRSRSYLGFLVFAGIHLLLALPAWAGYECQECPKRDIAVFDMVMPPIEQDATLSYGDWLPMHLVGGGVLHALFEEDPSRNCLNFVDAQMAAGGSGAATAYQHSMGGFTAPAGAIKGADYIIAGEIAVPQMGSQYRITISLEAAESREVVATAGGTYDFSKGGGANGGMVALQLMPLMEKIRDFERRKRDEAPSIAIDVDEGFTVEPEREFIKTNETTRIKFSLEDCDGTPLAGRIFAPFVSLGRLDVRKAPQTDDNGELELEFTAGSKTGTARINVEFPYVLPFGREDTGGGTGRIQIVDHSLWATFKVRYERHFNRDEETDYGKKIFKENVNASRAFSVYMYFEPKPFEVFYAKNRPTPVPVRFRHRLAGIVPGQFVHHASGNSYEAVRGPHGIDSSITASFSEIAQAGPIELRQKEIDFVTYEIDPNTKVVTSVDLPVLESKYQIIATRRCEKIDNYRKTREDCSSTDKKESAFSTDFPAEKECQEIAATGPTMVSGKCRVPFQGKYENRTMDIDWEFHRD